MFAAPRFPIRSRAGGPPPMAGRREVVRAATLGRELSSSTGCLTMLGLAVGGNSARSFDFGDWYGACPLEERWGNFRLEETAQ
jgi:hypothetical protein